MKCKDFRICYSVLLFEIWIEWINILKQFIDYSNLAFETNFYNSYDNWILRLLIANNNKIIQFNETFNAFEIKCLIWEQNGWYTEFINESQNLFERFNTY